MTHDQWLPSCVALIIALFTLNIIPGLLGLKHVEVIAPKYVRRGADVRLSCHYDLEKETLYATKWYKGPPPFKEFFRFLPKETPPALAFNLPGVYVDVTISNDHDVVLKNASFQTSGLYKCSVAAEFPFETRDASTEIRVIVIGESEPVMRLDNRPQYHPGDLVSAECRTPPSFPSSNITWYINDIKDFSGSVLKTETRKDEKDPLTKTTISSISFNLPEKVTPVRIYCHATVLAVYDKKSNVTIIHPIPRRLTGTETLLRSGSSSRASTESVLLVLLLGLLNFEITCKNSCSTALQLP